MSLDCLFEYEIPKLVIIRSIPLKLICRVLQFLVLLYGLAYLMIYRRGYQEHDSAIVSSIIFRTKGVHDTPIKQNQPIIIDDADYLVPSQEKDALFLMTNSIQVTQEYKRCPEAPYVKEAMCSNDFFCQANRGSHNIHGTWTGRCLKENSSSILNSQSKVGRCELEGWCPVLDDYVIPTPSHDTLNFTVFIKNFITFKHFLVIRSNMHQNPSYLKKCNYDPGRHRTCPVFRIGTILDLVEPDPNEKMKMLQYGTVIRLNIDWNCNLDRPLDRCQPYYSFGRLDTRFSHDSFLPGYNFRFASHWTRDNRSFRTLTKAYGLRIFVSVTGNAGRFDLFLFIFQSGVLIGLMYLIGFICDRIAIHIYSGSVVERPQKAPAVVELSKRENEQA